jgi:hypothetical protein
MVAFITSVIVVQKGVLLVFQTQVMVPLKDQGLILLPKALMLLKSCACLNNSFSSKISWNANSFYFSLGPLFTCICFMYGAGVKGNHEEDN